MSVVVTTGDLVSAANWNGLAFGTLGYAEVTANQANITSETDLTGLSVAVDVEASRRIKITGHAVLKQDTAGGIITGYIKESTTKLGRWVMHSGTTDEFILGDGTVIVTPSEGSHTYKLSLETTAGDVDMSAGAELPAFILVEDIGSA